MERHSAQVKGGAVKGGHGGWGSNKDQIEDGMKATGH